MAEKKNIQEMLVAMGFKPNYIQRAFKVYEKNYGHNYNVEVITEIIVRLQNKDLKKQADQNESPNNVEKKKKSDENSKNNKKKSVSPQPKPPKQKQAKQQKQPKEKPKERTKVPKVPKNAKISNKRISSSSPSPSPSSKNKNKNKNKDRKNKLVSSSSSPSPPKKDKKDKNKDKNKEKKQINISANNDNIPPPAYSSANYSINNNMNMGGNMNNMGNMNNNMNMNMNMNNMRHQQQQQQQMPSSKPMNPLNNSNGNINIGAMSSINRSQSGGNNKQKPYSKPIPVYQMPNKPLPNNNNMMNNGVNNGMNNYSNQQQQQQHNSSYNRPPPPAMYQNNNMNNNNNVSKPPNRNVYNNNMSQHSKANTTMNSSINKSSHNAPPPPPKSKQSKQFNKGDIVIYRGAEAQIKALNAMNVEITYPLTVNIMARKREKVLYSAITAIKKKTRESSKVITPSHSPPKPSSHSSSSSSSRIKNKPKNSHQYSQSQMNNNNNNTHNRDRHNHNMSKNSRNSTNTVNINMNDLKNGSSSMKKQQQSGSSPKPKNIKPKQSILSKKTSYEHLPQFDAHMSDSEADKLRLHDKIDHRDQVGRFVFATISEKTGSNLKIHYDGWSRKWDTWSDYKKELHRFAKSGSISKRPAHRFRHLKKGDYVDINPSQRHPGWKCGEIRRLDQKSGQVQVVYECADKNYLYWAHLDNRKEIAEFTSKSGTMHTVQQNVEDQIAKKKQGGIGNMNNISMNNNMKSMQGRPNMMNNGGGNSGYYQQQQQGGGMQQQQQYGQQQQNNNNNNAQYQPVDEMVAFERIRAKRFPKYPNEKIQNPYGIGDWLEVQDTQTHQWITATVIDKENNWIVVHFDGWPSKYDQKIHAVKHQLRLRALGSGLKETQEEKDIKEEMANFLREVEQLNWKLVVVDADGNCLYRCFGTQIYGDTNTHLNVRAECCDYMRKNESFFQNFIPNFDSRMKQKEQEYEWGDHVDITALSELYNVRVRVFEYDKEKNKLYMSFDQGEHEETVNLPLILLARHRQKHYNIIVDPHAVHKRPLKHPSKRKDAKNSINLRDLRLREDAKLEEHKDDEKDADDDDVNMGNNNNNMDMNNNMNMNNNNSGNLNFSQFSGDSYRLSRPNTRHSMNSDQFDLDLSGDEFDDILDTWNLCEPLQDGDLKNMFKPLLKKLHNKLIFQWNTQHVSMDKNILDRYWAQQFEEKQQTATNCKKWIDSLHEKVPNQQYGSQVCLTSFNQTIANRITENLGHIVTTRNRESTVDVLAYNNSSHHAMDIDN